MKKLALTISLCYAALSYGQDKLSDILPLIDNKVAYSEVVYVEGVGKSELYNRAKKWFVTTYKPAKDVIQMENIEFGEIMGTGAFKVSFYLKNPIISHTVTLSVKDGRFKYLITDLVYADNQGDKFPLENYPKSWFGKKKLFETVDNEVRQLIVSIEKSMKSKTEEW